jgi:WXG100 family type VII secretion target
MLRYSVDLDELDRVIADMTAFEGRLTKHLAALDATVATLHGTWSGDAARAQKAAHDRWTKGAKELHKALAEMKAAAARAHRNYTSAGEANVRMWRSVR